MTASKTVRSLQDTQIDVKIRLSLLWVTLLFCYTYADILGFYAPGNLEELLSGAIAGIQMTPGVLLGSALLMRSVGRQPGRQPLARHLVGARLPGRERADPRYEDHAEIRRGPGSRVRGGLWTRGL